MYSGEAGAADEELEELWTLHFQWVEAYGKAGSAKGQPWMFLKERCRIQLAYEEGRSLNGQRSYTTAELDIVSAWLKRTEAYEDTAALMRVRLWLINNKLVHSNRDVKEKVDEVGKEITEAVQDVRKDIREVKDAVEQLTRKRDGVVLSSQETTTADSAEPKVKRLKSKRGGLKPGDHVKIQDVAGSFRLVGHSLDSEAFLVVQEEGRGDGPPSQPTTYPADKVTKAEERGSQVRVRANGPLRGWRGTLVKEEAVDVSHVSVKFSYKTAGLDEAKECKATLTLAREAVETIEHSELPINLYDDSSLRGKVVRIKDQADSLGLVLKMTPAATEETHEVIVKVKGSKPLRTRRSNVELHLQQDDFVTATAGPTVLRGIPGKVMGLNERTAEVEVSFGPPGDTEPTAAALCRREKLAIAELERAADPAKAASIQRAPLVLCQGKGPLKGVLADVVGFEGKNMRISAKMRGARQEARATRRQILIVGVDEISPEVLADALLRWEVENAHSDPRLPPRAIAPVTPAARASPVDLDPSDLD